MYRVKADGQYVYHPWGKNLKITKGQLTLELGKNGQFDLTIPIENPMYGHMQARKSVVEIERFRITRERKIVDQATIYRGLMIDEEEGLDLCKEVQTDGDMVSLNDSVIRPYTSRNTTPQADFSTFIAEHNSQVDEFKRFVVGTVSVSGSSRINSQSSYMTTMEKLEALRNESGGYIVTRTVNGVTYIDWLSGYSHTNSQPIRYGKNVLDITKYIKTDDLCTRIIPLGKEAGGVPTTIKSVNNNVDYLEDADAISAFGVITKIVNFDIDSPASLKEAGQAYLDSNKGTTFSVEVSAVDLANSNIDIEYLDLGDFVPCIAPAYGIRATMQITKIVLDVVDLSSSVVTLGASMTNFTQSVVGQGSTINAAVLVAGNASAVAYAASEVAEQASQDVQALSSQIDGIAGTVYPVGSFFETSDQTFDPGTSWGGTWASTVESGVYRWHRTA